MTNRFESVVGVAALFILMTGPAISSAVQPEPETRVTDVVKLSDSSVTESSGLAASWRKPGHFWTHNDSGGRARLYAFNQQGTTTGRIDFGGIKASDWEDMASYVDAGVPRLLVADCGDNQRRRRSITLYVMDEPDPDQSATLDGESLEIFSVTYPDGPRDCEAVAVDPQRREIILVTKSFLPAVGVYTVPLPPRTNGKLAVRHEAIAKRIATLSIPMVTAMDIDQKSGDIWVAGYFQAFCFPCRQRRGAFAEQLGELPKPLELPRWRQIEAFAVDSSRRLWLTSEGSPMPMGRIPDGKAD